MPPGTPRKPRRAERARAWRAAGTTRRRSRAARPSRRSYGCHRRASTGVTIPDPEPVGSLRSLLTLFQITGSTSFAARAALEEAGAAYGVVDVHPRRRAEAPGFAEANPLLRVPALRDGDVAVYETAAVLAYVAERFPGAGLAPAPGDPARGAYLRWLAWLGNTLHDAYQPVNVPHFLTDDPAGHDGIARKGREKLDRLGAYLEQELTGRDWCLGDRYSVADVYLYMLVGWQSYVEGGYLLGGDAVQAHNARVGDRPAIARTRELDDLDERLQRHHPDRRGGTPL